MIKAKTVPYRRRGKPWHRPGLQNLDDYDIVRTYGAEYRGIVNYYLLAQDVWRLSVLCWYAQTSMLKTLAAKHKSSVAKMAARSKAKVITGHGARTCFEARRHREGKKDLVARFGGIPLKQDRRAVIHDPAPARTGHPRKELIHRLLKRVCELCEYGTTVAVHQVTALKQLGKPGPAARVGRPRGEDAAQDPYRLRRLPCLDPGPSSREKARRCTAGRSPYRCRHPRSQCPECRG